MQEYPKMLYKDGGNVELESGFFFTCKVNSKDEEKQKIERGWKHKPVIGDGGLDEKYKLESENEELKRQLEELRAQKQDMIDSGEATKEDFEQADEDQENPDPKKRGRRPKAE